MTGVAAAAGTGRDTRLDLLRGLAIVFVVVNHIDQRSLWHLLTVERVGLVTGAEVFVLLSGVVLGMVHARRTARAGWRASASALLRRSRTLYLTSVVVVLAVLLLQFVPGVDDAALATYQDGRTGRVYDLYDGAGEPSGLLRGVALLVFGPGEFNIMGLYVVLLALAPLALYLLVRGWWPVLVVAALAGYVLAHAGVDRLLPSQFENSFSLLAWQLLFFGGLVVGFHRERLATALAGRPGRLLVSAAALLAVLFAVLASTSPWLLGPRLPLISAGTFTEVYLDWFDRRLLAPGRLLNVVVLCVFATALLGRWPRVLDSLPGRYLVALGRATLYVFVVHLALVLTVDNLAGGQQRGLLFGTVAHAAAVALLVLMVRRRVLFRMIPR